MTVKDIEKPNFRSMRLFDRKFNFGSAILKTSYDYTDIVNIKRWVDRFVSPALSRAEYGLLCFIFERTIGFRKCSETIPYRHMSEGVISGESLITTGTGYCITYIKKLVRSLCAKGVLVREENPRVKHYNCSYTYQINLTWKLEELKAMLKDGEDNFKKESEPRLLKMGSESKKETDYKCTSPYKSQRALSDPPAGTECPSEEALSAHINSKLEVNSKLEENSKLEVEPTAHEKYDNTDSLGKLEEVTKLIKENSRNIETDKYEKLKNKKLTTGDIEFLWVKTLRPLAESYGRKPTPFSGKDKGNSTQILKRLYAAEVPVVPFIEFCLTEWVLILNTKFYGLESPPEYPRVGFILSCLDKFIDSYLNQEDILKLKDMTEWERIVHYCIRKGMSREAAERQADKRTADRGLIAEAKNTSKQMASNYKKVKDMHGSLSSFLMKARKQLKDLNEQYVSGAISKKELEEKSKEVNLDEVMSEIESFEMPEYSLEAFESNFSEEELNNLKGLN